MMSEKLMRCRPSPAETIETYPSVPVARGGKRWPPICAGNAVGEADVKKTMENGHTPLFEAARKGHLPVVAALLAAQADANKTDIEYGASPFPLERVHSLSSLFLLHTHTHTNTHTCARAQHTRARTLLDVVCAYELSFCLRS